MVEKKKKFKNWVWLVLVIIVCFIGYRTLSTRKALGERKALLEEQRQILVENWGEQGLSEEEIQQKLESMGSDKFSEKERPVGAGVIRLFTGGRKSGR